VDVLPSSTEKPIPLLSATVEIAVEMKMDAKKKKKAKKSVGEKPAKKRRNH
jgi:hypothetical protein